MAVYPNGIRTAVGFMHVGRLSGGLNGVVNEVYRGNLAEKLGSRIGSLNPTAGQLEGYHLQPLMPRIAGAMASVPGDPSISLNGSGSLLNGGPVQGTATLSLEGAGDLSLIVFLEGEGSLELAAAAAGLNLTLSLSGTAEMTLTGAGGLTIVVPLDPQVATMTLNGSGDLRGRLLLEAGVEETTLTADAVARAVWAAVATANDLPGTMGELLNASGAGGLSPSQATMLLELWRMRGLDPTAPVTVTVTSETAGTIQLEISGDGQTTSTLTRQP